MKCWYDGLIELRKGEIVKITKGYDTEYEGYKLRVPVFDVLTNGEHHSSMFDGKVIPDPEREG